MLIARLLVFALLPAFAGCAGMNQAVTTLPNALDDLAAKSEGFRRGREPVPRPAPVPPPPGPF